MNGNFDSEPPTWSNRIEHRAVRLLQYWKKCSPSYQKMLERMAKKGAELPSRPRSLALLGSRRCSGVLHRLKETFRLVKKVLDVWMR